MLNHPFTTQNIRDKRIVNRMHFVLDSMTAKGSAVVNQIFPSYTDKTGAYRMLNNEHFTSQDMVDCYSQACSETIKHDGCRHVLCIQDTSEINYDKHAARMHKKDRRPGIVSNNEVGCFVHPSLMFDADTRLPIGFSNVTIWSRQADAPGCRERQYKKLPVEAKESFRWCESVDRAKQVAAGCTVTVVSDREADIYEHLKRADDNVHILVRSNQNRRVAHHDQKLHELISQSHVKHRYTLHLLASHGRKARDAQMELRYMPVEIAAPAGKKDVEQTVRLYCIQVSEVLSTVPAGQTPLSWTLLTSHEITSTDQALECVEWYKCRWFIEELFRLSKRKGFCIEDIQLENQESIAKNILIALYAILRIIVLKHSFNNAEECMGIAAEHIFDEDEVQTAEYYARRFANTTVKQQNPFLPRSLPWIAWIIARMGAWSGYFSQPKPGYITFKRGLDALLHMTDFYKTIKKDVYKG